MERKERIILHSDLNNFYASCECLSNPALANLPVVVCGSIKDRHGVVLAKNYIAKKDGVKTGMTLVEAQRIFPKLVAVEADHDKYLYYSKKVKEIYLRYTNFVESFGIDEAWLDVTSSVNMFGDAKTIAEEIKNTIKQEIGLNVTIGISFNKIFAKLASDKGAPFTVNEISKDNFKQLVWPLPIKDLLFVGRQTAKKLNNMGVFTIGAIANYNLKILIQKFGKVGEVLWNYANGLDSAPVREYGNINDYKSVGNSTTFYRDINNYDDFVALVCMLSESVTTRLKKYNLGKPKTLHLSIVDNELNHYGKQSQLDNPSICSNDFSKTALKIYNTNFLHIKKIRGVGISVSDFVTQEQEQLCAFKSDTDKNTKVDDTIINLRNRFGKNAICRALILKDEKFKNIEFSGHGITNKSDGLI